jgi:phosphotransferase system HPr (HPr) family protein
MTPMTATSRSTLCQMRLVVSCEHGLHLRAASMIVKIAESYDAQLTIECGPNRVNGKSIMSLLGLGVSNGMSILAITEGAEADRMIWALTELFANRFYEATDPTKGPRR